MIGGGTPAAVSVGAGSAGGGVKAMAVSFQTPPSWVKESRHFLLAASSRQTKCRPRAFMCGMIWAAVGVAGQPGATRAAVRRMAWVEIIRSRTNSDGAPTSTAWVLPTSAICSLRSERRAGRSSAASKAA